MRDCLEIVGPADDTTRQQNVDVVHRIYREVSASHRLPGELFDRGCVTDWTQVSPDFGVLVVRLSSHTDRSTALEAAGLRADS